MKVLIACEFSGRVRRAFTSRGHDVTSCDLLPSYDNSTNHIIGDVTPLLRHSWDLVIAHPPCTYLANSGIQHLVNNRERWDSMLDGVAFFKLCLNANATKVCVENPRMHRYAEHLIGKSTQKIHPYMFGELDMKETHLWLHNLPLLIETENVKDELYALPKNKRSSTHLTSSKGEKRRVERSITFLSIAEAMATQWG